MPPLMRRLAVAMTVKELFLLAFLTVQVSCARNSLTFVIDDTASMYDDIRQVKQAAKSIIDIVLKEKSTQIEDIVLVTFNDPDTRFRKRTRNERELKEALESINVHDGGDCPELALSGIKQALEESQPGSYLFIFTDASAKDLGKFQEIKTLCQEKQSQLVFIITGNCGDIESDRFQVYHKLAAASNGQVFRINKNEVGQVLEYVKETIKGDRSVITSVIVPAHVMRDIKFNVDDQTEYAIVSASGTDVILQILDQRNMLMWSAKQIIWTRNVKVLKLTNLSTGTYTARVKGNSEVNIMVFGRTDFTFDHGFSTKVESSLRTTETQPTVDAKTHLMISVKDPEHSTDVQYVELLDMKEKVIKKLPLTRVPGTDASQLIYATEKFLPPEDTFKIAVIATARKTGKIIRRISKTPVTPIKPVLVAPEISKTDNYIKVKEGESFIVHCRIRKGKPKPQISWALKQEGASTFQVLPGQVDQELHVTKAVTSGYYKCIAENKVRSDEHFVQVDVLAPPEFEDTPAVITVNVGEPVSIECKLRKGNPRPKSIAWQFKPTNRHQFVMTHSGEIHRISSVRVDQAGEYRCSAENSEGRREKVTTLVVQAKPVIKIPTPMVTAMENTVVTLQCQVTGGYPKPTVTWYYKSPHSLEDVTITENKEVVRIDKIQLSNAGHYKCIARNTFGSMQGDIEVVVNAPPRILTKKTEYTGVEGDVVMKLPCAAVGHPTPTIVWVVDKQVVGNDKSKGLYVKENALFLRNPKEEDSSDNSHTYKCYARNEFGEVVQPYNVSITKYPEYDDNRNETYGMHKQPYDLNCPLPYTDPNSVRWYKNAILVDNTGPALHFDNPTQRDNGNYTCRVSDLTGAVSHNVELGFGFPPTRNGNRLSFNVQWQGESASIDCTADQVPTGKYTWFYNGKEVKGVHTTSLELNGWGQYTCNVTNPLGSLEVKYKVTSRDCAIPSSLLKTKHIPLTLDSSSSWPAVTHTGKYIMVPHSEDLKLICQDDAPDTKSRSPQNRFTKFQDKRSIIATCDHEEAFLVDGVPRKFSELDCKDTVAYSVVKKDNTCLGDNTQLMQVGFHVNGFTDVYESCVDVIKNVPLYTKMNTIPFNKVESVGIDVKVKKSCLDECCYEKIQLVNAEDVSFGPAEQATFIDSLNSVNYCKPKNNTNWHDLEVITRTETRFTVWSGAANYKKIDAIWVPKYLWKVLKEVDTSETIAVIHVNEPTPGDRLCSAECGESSSWFEPQGDRTYCCSLEDFKEALALTIDFDEE